MQFSVASPNGAPVASDDWGLGNFAWNTSGLAAGTYRVTLKVRHTGSAAIDAQTTPFRLRVELR